MDKTASIRQQRYRKKIAKGVKTRLQVVIDSVEAKKLDEICIVEKINKTQFVRRCIDQWDKEVN